MEQDNFADVDNNLQESRESSTPPIAINILDAFIDPISQEIMEDPVIAEDNFTYSRETITNWISQSSGPTCRSPRTGLPMGKILRPNIDMKRGIEEWQRMRSRSIPEEFVVPRVEYSPLETGILYLHHPSPAFMMR